ncbi:MAG: hypothetical protein AAF725_24330, partial [Acidobacteriota bacterium]
MRQPLVDQLFALVPTLEERESRRRVLKLKRQIFNGRVPAGPPPAELPSGLSAEVQRYSELAARLAGLLERVRVDALTASRHALRSLLAEERFRVAVEAASPDLARDLGRFETDKKLRFTNAEASLYNYAARYFGKANPFHLLASIEIPGAARSGLQLSLEAQGLLILEARLLQSASSPKGPLRLALPPWARHGDRCLFWLATPSGLRVCSHPSSAGLDRVLEFFSRRSE